MSTPEFCFLQMASQLTQTQLILLGFELCGTYVIGAGDAAAQREGSLTTVERLRAFIETAPHAPGRAKARRAVRYVINGSASIMESILVLLLCLPNRMGGYGLPAPLLNYCIPIPPSFKKIADRKYCRGDLCWPDAKLCLEYDSELYHANETRRQSDARRRNTLITMGIMVVTVTVDQMRSTESLNRLANQIAKKVGKRLRLHDPAFTRAHLVLHRELWDALSACGDRAKV